MKEMRLLPLEKFWADYQHFFSSRHRLFGEVTVVYLGKDEKIHLSQNRRGKMKVRKQTVNSVAHFSCAMIANMKYIFTLSVVQGQAFPSALNFLSFIIFSSTPQSKFFSTSSTGSEDKYLVFPCSKLMSQCITCFFFRKWSQVCSYSHSFGNVFPFLGLIDISGRSSKQCLGRGLHRILELSADGLQRVW